MTSERVAVAIGLAVVALVLGGLAARRHRAESTAASAAGPVVVSSGACGRTIAQSDEALRSIEVEGCPRIEGDDVAFLGCSPSGSWATSIERAVRSPVEGGTGVDPCGAVGMVVTLTHFAKDGSPVVVSPASSLATKMKTSAGEVTVNASLSPRPGSRHIDEPSFFDFDGDGDEEVVLFASADEEGYDPEIAEVWTFKGGVVVPYAPASGIAFDAVTDVDGDGRPDLVGRGPYAKILAESETGDSFPIAPRFFVARALAGGAFDVHAPESIAYAKTQCGPRAPVDFENGSFDDALATAIVCARILGASAESLHTEAAHRCRGTDRCPLWVSALIDVEPPFVAP